MYQFILFCQMVCRHSTQLDQAGPDLSLLALYSHNSKPLSDRWCVLALDHRGRTVVCWALCGELVWKHTRLQTDTNQALREAF